MLKRIFLLVVCLLLSTVTLCQSVIIKGRIKCSNAFVNSTKGAENVVLVPTFKPSISTITASEPTGYFEFNTGVSITKLQDKIISIYAITRCIICKEITKRVFISEDQDRNNSDAVKRYVTVKDWILNANCNNSELKPVAADSVLRIMIRQPDQNLDHVSSASALVGTPTLLNVLTKLVALVGSSGFPSGQFMIDSFSMPRTKYGETFFASSMIYSGNLGFNFAPGRDKSDANFFNPSAMSFHVDKGQLSLFTNGRNQFKLGGFYSLKDKFSFGIGLLGSKQFERRRVYSAEHISFDGRSDTAVLYNKEFGIYLSSGYKLNHRWSLGITLKSSFQYYNYPDSLFVGATGNNPKADYTYLKFNRKVVDADVSASYKLNNSFQIGLNIMNIAGSRLLADIYKPGKDIPIKHIKQRAIGLGVTYKKDRINFGTDFLYREGGILDAAFGVNYVPFNNALVSLGMETRFKAFSLAFKWKHFKMAYIDDHDWLTDDRQKNRSGILRGRIFGGFVYNLH